MKDRIETIIKHLENFLKIKYKGSALLVLCQKLCVEIAIDNYRKENTRKNRNELEFVYLMVCDGFLELDTEIITNDDIDKIAEEFCSYHLPINTA